MYGLLIDKEGSMFEPGILYFMNQQFKLEFPGRLKQTTFWIDLLLGIVVGGVGILGLYNLATFSLGGT